MTLLQDAPRLRITVHCPPQRRHLFEQLALELTVTLLCLSVELVHRVSAQIVVVYISSPTSVLHTLFLQSTISV